MESLVNYGSDDDNDSPSPSKDMGGAYGPARTNSNEDNYEAVVMDMSETLLNPGNKAQPKSGQNKSCRRSRSPAIALYYSDGLDSNASNDNGSDSPQSKRRSPEPTGASKPRTPDDDDPPRRKVPEHHGSRPGRDRERDRERSRSRSGSRIEPDRSRGSGRDRHHRSSPSSRDHDRRDRDRGRDRGRDRERERDRDRDRDDRHGSRRGEDRRKRSRSGSRSDSRSPSGSPSRGADKYRRGGDQRRGYRKDAPSSSNSKNRGDREREGGGRQNTGRPGPRSSGFYNSKISNKINVLERLGIALKPADAVANPQAMAQRAGEQQAAQVKLASGVELPSYLNPAATQRFAEHMQKKRLLWGARKDEPAGNKLTDPSASKWQGTTFAQDHDGKVAAKFNRLMGIKGAGEKETKPDANKGDDIIKKQEEMFHNMESQYEVARLATHTHRGLGLGFGAFQPR